DLVRKGGLLYSERPAGLLRKGGFFTPKYATTLPAYVAIGKTGELLVAELARRQAFANPDDTIYGIKRFIGRKWGEPARRQWPVEEEAIGKTYKITRAANNEVRVLMDGKEYSPTDIFALILQKLKADAEVFLSGKVTD